MTAKNVKKLLDVYSPLPVREAPSGFATEVQSSPLNLFKSSNFSKQINTPFITINLHVSDNLELLNDIVLLFQALPNADKTANKFLNLSIERHGNLWTLCHDNSTELITHLEEKQTVPYLLDVVMTTFYREIGYCSAFHGAAVQWQNSNLLFPAPSGSGKSTLFAHLVHNQKAIPYSDEVIVLDYKFNPLQVPFPMTLKTGSWPLFKDIKFTNKIWQRTDGRALKYHSLEWPPTKKGLPTVMIFPQYQAEQNGHLHKIGPCKAMFNLGLSGYEFFEGENEMTIGQLLDWLNTIKIYEMIYPNSLKAEQMLREIL